MAWEEIGQLMGSRTGAKGGRPPQVRPCLITEFCWHSLHKFYYYIILYFMCFFLCRLIVNHVLEYKHALILGPVLLVTNKMHVLGVILSLFNCLGKGKTLKKFG